MKKRLLATVALLVGCRQDKWFDATVEIDRIGVVRFDPATRRPLTMDLEISYVECPGEQIEVVRGGQDFAACIERHKVGERVPVRVRWYRHRDGHHAWEVHEVAGCKRPPDPEDEGSFAQVQDCQDVKVFGAVVGFHCDRVPGRALVEKCPWFRRE